MGITARFESFYRCASSEATDIAGADVTRNVEDSTAVVLTSGTGAGQADLDFDDVRTLADGAADDLDLTALTNARGKSVNFKRVKGIRIINRSATKTLTVSPGSSNGWSALVGATGQIALPPGGQLHIASADATGWATSGSSKVLKIANSAGAAASYYICLVGASA